MTNNTGTGTYKNYKKIMWQMRDRHRKNNIFISIAQHNKFSTHNNLDVMCTGMMVFDRIIETPNNAYYKRWRQCAVLFKDR